ACSHPCPPLFSRLRLTFADGATLLEVNADVVRHVSAAEAEGWRMLPGFAVQFPELGPELRRRLTGLLARLHASKEPGPPGAGGPGGPGSDVLDYFRSRALADHYQLLGLPLEASSTQVRQRLQQLRA